MNLDNGVATTIYYTSDTNSKVFSDDFEIIVLNVESCDTEICGFKWNHGRSSGVVISREKNIIVYWAESW